MRSIPSLCLKAWPTIILVLASCAARDWPAWRGPEQSGLAREAATVTSWSQDGKNLLWKVPVGGRTTPVVLNGRLYAITPVGEGEGRQERVICLDAETGRTLWQHRFNVFLTDIVENRIGWTSLVGDPETGNVFAHGTGGEFFCFAPDGVVLWKRSMTEELGRISGYGGRLHTPIIDENRVIVSFLNSSWGSHARPLHRYVAFEKQSGRILWWAAPGGTPLDTTYSTPVVTVIDGRRLLIAANADGNVYGMLARTGQKVWTFRLSKRGLNTSIVASGRYVYASHSEENLDNIQMGRVVCIDASGSGDITESGEVWRFDGKTVGYSSPAIANQRLYVVTNSATLYCLDAGTGEVYWEHSIGRVAKGSPVVTADGVIYVGEQNGVFHILQDTGDSCQPLDVEEFAREDGRIDELFGSPAVVGGRVYFMTRYHTYCLGTKVALPKLHSLPPIPSERPADPSAPGRIMLHPADVTLAPGEQIRLNLRPYDVNGRELSDQVIKSGGQTDWTVSGALGAVSSDGTFYAARDNAFSAGEVAAQWNGLKAAARIRIKPELPVHENFESLPTGSVPPGWVGVASKTRIVDRDGGKVLRKLASKSRPSPPFMRIRGYFMPPIAGGYTVEADLLGTIARERFKPDLGLINSRYRLLVLGMQGKLRIDSWDPLPRIQEDVPFIFEPHRWYRMKFQVEVAEAKANVRGKMWPRDEPEPKTWTIELTDNYPNREGSPGIYGYSPGTTSKSDGPEIFYDNLEVTRNE